jgi:hypothetical protein
MDQIIAYVPVWNGWIALLLYWVPLVLCAVGYSVRATRRYNKDRIARAKADADPKGWYYPELKLGDLIGYAFLTACPLVNLLMVIFDVGAPMIREFFEWLGSVLGIPLVPSHKK